MLGFDTPKTKVLVWQISHDIRDVKLSKFIMSGLTPVDAMFSHFGGGACPLLRLDVMMSCPENPGLMPGIMAKPATAATSKILLFAYQN